MRDARPAGVTAGPVALTARPLSPYRVAIRRTADAVTLTGHMPDTATRERVLDALRPRLFREPIIDRTRLAEGAPAGSRRGAGRRGAPGDEPRRRRGRGLGPGPDPDRREPLPRERRPRARPAGRGAAPGLDRAGPVSARQPAERRDPETCRADVAAILAGASLRFPAGSAVLAPAFYPTLDALAALAKACPSLRLAVSGPADPAKASPTPAAGPARRPPRPPPNRPGSPARPSRRCPTSPRNVWQARGDARTGPAMTPRQRPRRATGYAAGKAIAGKAAPAKTDRGQDGRGQDRQAGFPGRTPPGRSGRAAARRRKKPAEAAEEPPQDLARLRAQAVVEYLLQAGARPGSGQRRAGRAGRAGRLRAAAVRAGRSAARPPAGPRPSARRGRARREAGRP